jgi:hypothetical protein
MLCSLIGELMGKLHGGDGSLRPRAAQALVFNARRSRGVIFAGLTPGEASRAQPSCRRSHDAMSRAEELTPPAGECASGSRVYRATQAPLWRT